MRKKLLAAVAALLVVGGFAIVRATSADAGCLSNAYLKQGGLTVEQVFDGNVAGTIGTAVARERAMENASSLQADNRRVIDSELATVSGDAFAQDKAMVYVVATPVDGSVHLTGVANATAACEVSFVDAHSGAWLFSFMVAEPPPGASVTDIVLH